MYKQNRHKNMERIQTTSKMLLCTVQCSRRYAFYLISAFLFQNGSQNPCSIKDGECLTIINAFCR